MIPYYFPDALPGHELYQWIVVDEEGCIWALPWRGGPRGKPWEYRQPYTGSVLPSGRNRLLFDVEEVVAADLLGLPGAGRRTDADVTAETLAIAETNRYLKRVEWATEVEHELSEREVAERKTYSQECRDRVPSWGRIGVTQL